MARNLRLDVEMTEMVETGTAVRDKYEIHLTGIGIVMLRLRLSRRFWSFALLHRMHKPLPLKQNWRTKSLVLAVTYSTSSLCSINAPMGSCSLNHRQITISLEPTAFTLSAFQLLLLRMLLMKPSETLPSPRHHTTLVGWP